MPTTLKQCTKCYEPKPLDQYSISRQGVRGPVYRTECKPCQATRARQWYDENQDRAKENRRRHQLESLYGLSIAQYEELLLAQGGVCAVCGLDEPNSHGRTGKKFRLAVDHCHETGRVRGLLCQKCNRAIGLLNDNTDLLRKAIGYLERE